MSLITELDEIASRLDEAESLSNAQLRDELREVAAVLRQLILNVVAFEGHVASRMTSLAWRIGDIEKSSNTSEKKS